MAEEKKSFLITCPGQLAFVHAAQKANMSGKYEATLVIKRDHKYFLEHGGPEALKRMQAAVEENVKLAKQKYGPNRVIQKPWRKGSDKGHLSGFRDEDIYITCRTDGLPILIDGRQTPIDRNDPDGVYAGCWAVLKVDCYPWEAKKKETGQPMNWGVSFGLNCIQKIADGERFQHQNTADGMEDIIIEDEATADVAIGEDDADFGFGESEGETTDDVSAMF